MTNKIMEKLEILENEIENIKWWVTAHFSFRKQNGISSTISAVRRSAGILGKGFPKGTAFENTVRKEWKNNFLKRTR